MHILTKKIFFSALAVFSLASFHAQDISTDRIKKDITFLASDKLQGRGTGSPGEIAAGNYIAAQFKKAGLLPKGTQGYFQPFTFRKHSDPKDTTPTDTVKPRHGRNVIGYLDNGAKYTVVIGAHYDHLGLGYDHNSLDPNPQGKIHNGADDNASGAAGVMELARYFSTNNRKEAFNFLFICFSGEELGLIGSKKFCDSSTIDLKTVDYMINMDMIGRLNDSTKTLIIYGVGTAPDWVPMIDGMQTPFHIKKDSAGIGPSDQTSFYLQNIPVLHFFTGQHKDYHKPSDDVDKINFIGEKEVLQMIIDIVAKTESLPKLVFQQTRNTMTDTPKRKVTMGIMPDYAWEGKGVHIDGVTDNKPAAKAGIQKGDIITQIGDTPVNNMMDYMKAMGNYKPGDKIPVKLLRGDKEMVIDVVL